MIETRTLSAIAVALILSVSPFARAQLMLGPGAASCGSWITDKNNDRSVFDLDKAWVLGFISANQIDDPEVYSTKGTDINGLISWVDDYCTKHPLESIADATLALLNTLAAKNDAANMAADQAKREKFLREKTPARQ